ncbi:MAG: DNA-formamidopyrimidine glycosylase family protein [Promethearchaeota archaeon]|jgi:formamidopyrimidine-DNA glycosylase
MSIELPEALILTEQMNKEIVGKQIKSYDLHDYERLQKIGFLNKNIKEFDLLLDRKIKFVTSRGNLIRVELDNNNNLLIGPEYGGKVLYHKDDKNLPEKIHLKITFTDNTKLTVRLTGMGVIKTIKNNDLKHSYLYKRDFSDVLSPLDDNFTLNNFSELLSTMKRSIKSILVGKDAVLVGLSNSAFQDIIYRAKLFPKIKGSDLNEEEKKVLFKSIKTLVNERIRLGGKYQFVDLYGKKGQYMPAMGPNMKGKTCYDCGTGIEKFSVGGGQVYYCPHCQEE